MIITIMTHYYQFNSIPDAVSPNSESLEQLKSASARYWAEHDFFSSDTVVLGLDIGMEGIGICVRKGKDILYCKSLLVDLPESEALAKRRAFRASRHVRKNRRRRMRLLKDLFGQYGLPWVDDSIMSRSDPYILRHRAVSKKLASKEALSICIRSLVARRGYDYDAMKEQGNNPWGDSNSVKEVMSWLKTTFVDEKMVQFIKEREEELTEGKGAPLKEETREKLWELLQARKAASDKQDINAMTAAYAKQRISERQAKGMNYPRSMVRKNLEEIIDRHAHLIDDVEGFKASLFRPCVTKEDKGKAIFYYQRKTAEENRLHFEKKVKDCPLAGWLQLGDENSKCCLKGNAWFRLWKLVDFLSVRRFYLKKKEKGSVPIRRLLPASVIESLVKASVHQDDHHFVSGWKDVKAVLNESLACEGWMAIDKGGDVKDQKDWNKEQLIALQDLCSPSASSRQARASLGEASARKLYYMVTQNESNFDPECMEEQKKNCGLYEQRQAISLFGGTFPQVAALLGTIGPDKKNKNGRFVQKTTGILQRIFADLSPMIGGKKVPDYVVVECIRQAPRTETQKKEIEVEQKNNRASKDKMASEFGVGEGKLGRSKYFRIALWKQQGGSKTTKAICPFTGKTLDVDDPLSPQLELAHLYPDTKGGLYMMDNLVLTTREVNKAMDNMTPVEAARAGIFGISCDEMIRRSEQFAWGESKRKLFRFEPTAEESFPDFNNMTRISQLASQLRKQVAFWLGIHADSDDLSAAVALRERIGNPQGQYTAAMRRSLLPESGKDRSGYVHHREDAALLSCMPPMGLNSIKYKGIFYTKMVPWLDSSGQLQQRRSLFALSCADGLPLPDIASILEDDTECPIIKRRSESKYKALGDSTFWHVDEEGNTWQRTPLVLGKDTSADSLHAMLVASCIPENLIPSQSEIDKWISHHTPAHRGEEIKNIPLRLKNGVPVKSIWKEASKGTLINSPMGWSGTMSDDGIFREARSLRSSNDRLELWIGWNAKKQVWEYQTRVVPTREAMAGIRRMGLPWRNTKNIPPYLQKILKQKKVSSLKELISGKLCPHSIHVADIRKGMVAKIEFEYDVKKCPSDKNGLKEVMWGEVTAILTSGKVECKSLIRKDMKPYSATNSLKIAMLFGFPPPDEFAKTHSLKP